MRAHDTSNDTLDETIEGLMHEIERYLETVEVFRAEGAEPSWLDDEALPTWWLEEVCRQREPAPSKAARVSLVPVPPR